MSTLRLVLLASLTIAACTAPEPGGPRAPDASPRRDSAPVIDAAPMLDAAPLPDAVTAACATTCGPTEQVYCRPSDPTVCWCLPSYTRCVP